MNTFTKQSRRLKFASVKTVGQSFVATAHYFSSMSVFGRFVEGMHWMISFLVFAYLDFVDIFLCFLLKLVDIIFGQHWGKCYCFNSRNSWIFSHDCDNETRGQMPNSKQFNYGGLFGYMKESDLHSPSLEIRNTSDGVKSWIMRALKLLCLKSLKSSEKTEGLVVSSSNGSPAHKRDEFGLFLGGDLGVESEADSIPRSVGSKDPTSSMSGIRWSDCNCSECCEWEHQKQETLFFYMEENGKKSLDMEQIAYLATKNGSGHSAKRIRSLPNIRSVKQKSAIIFIHGFLSSSAFFVDTIFPQFSRKFKNDFVLIALDLVGFGKSPKPKLCQYSLMEHIQWIERSILAPLEIESFHIVSHSMGCVIALPLAAKHSANVQSVTLLAPPYKRQTPGEDLTEAYFKFAAPRRVWPPLRLGIGIMVWHEHVGRMVCMALNKFHFVWDPLLLWMAGKRVPESFMRDFSKHTHHSGFHSFHNTICGGMRFVDPSLERLRARNVPVAIVHGEIDHVCPISQTEELIDAHPWVNLRRKSKRDHVSIVLGHEKELAEEIEAMVYGSSMGFAGGAA